MSLHEHVPREDFFLFSFFLTLCRTFRAKILFALDKDLLEELEWLNGVSLKYLKNYQIWYAVSIIHLSLEASRLLVFMFSLTKKN